MASFPSTARFRRSPALLLGAAALLAAAAAVLPATPGFDPWGWLVWGREIADGDLDTRGGPSWKPLPALAAVPLSALGEAGPELWLWIVRWAWLAAAGLAAAVAIRMVEGADAEAAPGGRAAVGAIAAGGVVLLADSFTPWLRQGATGLSEPLLVALALGAFAAWQHRRHRLALLLLLGCALLRPEAWAVFAWLAVDRLRTGSERALVAVGVLAVPLLWFAPDLIGSGDPLTGAGRARIEGIAPLGPLESLGRLAAMPLAAMWAGAAAALVAAHRRRRREPLVLAVAGAAWAGQVALLAGLGYAGLPRFLAPAAAAVCVLAAVGYATVAGRLRGADGIPAAATLLAGVLVVGGLAQAAWRTGELVGDATGIAERAERERELDDAARLLGDGPAAGCRPVYLDDYLLAPALAWRLELPLVDVRPLPSGASGGPPAAGVAIVRSGEGDAPPGAVPLGTAGWAAIELGCPARPGDPVAKPPGSDPDRAGGVRRRQSRQPVTGFVRVP